MIPKLYLKLKGRVNKPVALLKPGFYRYTILFAGFTGKREEYIAWVMDDRMYLYTYPGTAQLDLNQALAWYLMNKLVVMDGKILNGLPQEFAK